MTKTKSCTNDYGSGAALGSKSAQFTMPGITLPHWEDPALPYPTVQENEDRFTRLKSRMGRKVETNCRDAHKEMHAQDSSCVF